MCNTQIESMIGTSMVMVSDVKVVRNITKIKELRIEEENRSEQKEKLKSQPSTAIANEEVVATV